LTKKIDEILPDDKFREFIEKIEHIVANIDVPINKSQYRATDIRSPEWIHLEIEQRIRAIGDIVITSELSQKKQIEDAILLFRDWMLNGTIVRIIGAGRAKLAGSIPASRLAHGGARVYIKEDIIPMPHTSKGGGIIAVSASGKTRAVLEDLKDVRAKAKHIKIVGFANKDAIEFSKYCDIFIGIDLDIERTVQLKALADIGEYAISELFDAMVVAAGKMAGFHEIDWRIGHENIGGSTGHYDAIGNDDELKNYFENYSPKQ